MTTPVVRVVVLVGTILARGRWRRDRAGDEVPAADVIDEAVAVVIHTGRAGALGPVDEHHAALARATAEIGVIRDHTGVEDADDDVAVA